MHFKKLFKLMIVFVAFSNVAMAQVTTGNLSGFVKTATDKVGLPGASIEAIHVPTGTKYVAIARKEGRYDIANVLAGGPYTVKASFVGFSVKTENDVYVTVGETQDVNFQMVDSKQTGDAAVVTAQRATTVKNGSETNIGRDRMANAPSVGRNLSDFVRLTPQVKITGDGGISVAGQNNRFNSFMIDGAVNNDVFGLSASGTNGGQAGVPPISIDAIDQINVKISDFDASIGNFTGGAINATTRGGTNQVTGSVYMYYRNENTTGRAPVQSLVPGSTTKYEFAKASSFTNRTIGARVGFPIIKNKLFGFVNVESQKDERPQPFDPSSYRGSALADGSLNSLVNYVKSTFNYDLGQYANNPDLIDRFNVNTRFDWNINAKNKLQVSYRLNDVTRTNPGRSSANAINFYNGSQLFPSKTNSGNIELNTKIDNKTSNKFRVSYTGVRDNRGFSGSPFPSVQIFDGPASINFGSEPFSTGNELNQDIFNFYNVYRKYIGKHNLSGGLDVDYNKMFNLFIPRAFGQYVFSNVDSFLLNKTPSRYRAGFSLVDGGKVGDEAVNAAAKFSSMRLGFFVNDDIKVNDNVTITLGLRADQFRFLDDALVDPFWNSDAKAIILANGYDIEGAEAGKLPKGRFMFSPRFGFKYTMPEDGFTFRGGTGLFVGRTPLVWPGGTYQNTGISVGGVDQSTAALYAAGIKFNANINSQPLTGTTNLPSGDLNLVAEDYKVPMVWRTTLAGDKKLGKGWTASTEVTFSKNVYEADWVNLAITKSTVMTGGVGSRPIVAPGTNPLLQLRSTGFVRPYTGIYLLRNSPDQTGYSFNYTMSVDKAFSNNWSFNTSYTFGQSFVNNEGTSSINASNWINMEKVGTRNTRARTQSDFSLGHRINSYASKKFNYLKGKTATTLTLVYTGQSGSPVSYILSNAGLTNDGAFNNDLMYVPATKAEAISMISASNTVNGIFYSAAQQADLFWAFIEGNKYLRSRKGQFTERNGSRTPFTHQIDLKLQQDFNVNVKGRRRSLQVALDVFNFTNLLNSQWGRQYFVSFDQIPVLSVSSIGTVAGVANTPQYRFTPFARPDRPWNFSDGVTPFNNSRWVGQATVRLNF